MKKQTISVCMTTYNGQKFILEQLESILAQSFVPDEVIICDDGSTDATVTKIKNFISEHKLEESWHLYCNEENKGYPENAYYAMSLCQGDLVFPADQDDIWQKDKIEKMYQAFLENNMPLLLASSWGIVDEKSKVVSAKQPQTNTLQSISVRQIFYKYEWPGMSMCYVNSFGKKVAEELKHSEIPHDMALALCAAERHQFLSMPECLQYHRNHDANEAMEEHRVLRRLGKKRKLIEIRRYVSMLDNIVQHFTFINTDNHKFVLRKREILLERQKNLEQKKFLGIIRQYLSNRDVIRAATMLCDCLICWQKG